jgi:hypothetical protein
MTRDVNPAGNNKPFSSGVSDKGPYGLSPAVAVPSAERAEAGRANIAVGNITPAPVETTPALKKYRRSMIPPRRPRAMTEI